MSTDKTPTCIRLPQSTKAKLEELAKLEHRSISNMVEVLVEKEWKHWTTGDRD